MPRNSQELESSKIKSAERDAIKILSEKFKKPPRPNFKIQNFTSERPIDGIIKPIPKKPNPSTHDLG
jgi:hypothetical protein